MKRKYVYRAMLPTEVHEAMADHAGRAPMAVHVRVAIGRGIRQARRGEDLQPFATCQHHLGRTAWSMLTVRITERMRAVLQSAATARRIPVSTIIQSGVREHLARQGRVGHG